MQQSIEKKGISLINHIILEFQDGAKFLPELLERQGYRVKYGKPTGVGILMASRDPIKPDQSILKVSNSAV